MNNESDLKDETLTDQNFRRLHFWLSAFLVLFAVVSLCGLFKLRFDDDLKNLFQGDTEEFKSFERYSRLFDSRDDQCIIVLTANSVLDPESLKKIRSIDSRIHEVENVEDINSICHLLAPKRVGRIFLPIMPYIGATDSKWIAAGQKLRDHPLSKGLLSEDDTCTLITFQFRKGTTPKSQLEAFEKVRQTLDEVWSTSKISTDDANSTRRYGLTGIPLLRKEVLSNLMRDQQKFTWLGLLFSLIIGWFLFRKPLPVFFVAFVPFLSLGCIMGWLGWMGISLNIVNNVITPLVLVIGFAEVVHILFLTGGFLGQGLSNRQAVVAMNRQLFVPCLLAALTTAIGFGSLYLSTDKSLREFAIVASLASLVMFCMVLSTSSCILATPLARFCVRYPRENKKRVARYDGRFSGWPLVFVVAVALILLPVFAWTASKNHTDFRFTENLPESNSAVQSLRTIDSAFGGSSADFLIVEFDEKPSTRKLLESLKKMRQKIGNVSEVGPTVSFIDVLDSMPPKGGSDAEHFRELKNLPRETWTGFLRLKPTIAKIQISLPDIGSHRLRPVIQLINDEVETLENQFDGVHIKLAGLNILASGRSQRMISDLTNSLIGASLAIFVLILLVYRSLIFSVAAIIVNAIPILGVAAIMFLFGRSIQYTGIMLLCVCLGLAVDDTVHFLSKVKSNLKSGEGFELAVLTTIKNLWPVFLTTSLMLGVGFGLAATSEIPTFQTFGGFACVALLLALLADLVVLPCLLILMNRVFKSYS